MAIQTPPLAAPISQNGSSAINHAWSNWAVDITTALNQLATEVVAYRQELSSLQAEITVAKQELVKLNSLT